MASARVSAVEIFASAALRRRGSAWAVVDRQLDELRQLHAKLADRVRAGDVLVGVDTSLGADKADVLARLRALADRVARLEGGRT